MIIWLFLKAFAVFAAPQSVVMGGIIHEADSQRKIFLTTNESRELVSCVLSPHPRIEAMNLGTFQRSLLEQRSSDRFLSVLLNASGSAQLSKVEFEDATRLCIVGFGPSAYSKSLKSGIYAIQGPWVGSYDLIRYSLQPQITKTVVGSGFTPEYIGQRSIQTNNGKLNKVFNKLISANSSVVVKIPASLMEDFENINRVYE